MRSSEQNGVSLLEMVITISIAMILMGISFMALRPMINESHVDSSYSTALTVLRNTRNLAITQSHEYYVTFNPPAPYPAGTILVQYQPPPPTPGGIAPPLEEVNTYTIETDVQFAVQAGFPANAPDGFGAGLVAIDFESVPPGVPLACQCVVFFPDGSSQDPNGNYNSGVVYITRPGDTLFNSRAITVFGATGRIRGWRLTQPGGVWTWTQQ